MSLIAKDKAGGDFELIPAQMHHAVLYGLYDIGTQPSNNPQYRPKHQVVFTWEIPDVRCEIERNGQKVNLPRAISRTMTLSLSSKSNMRPMLESWRGRAFTEAELDGFDIKKVLGANCLLNVIHEKKGDKTYANVASVSPLMPKMPRLKPENPIVSFDLSEFKGTHALPPNLPDWIKAKIMMSDEWLERSQGNGHQPGPTADEEANIDHNVEEDVPF